MGEMGKKLFLVWRLRNENSMTAEKNRPFFWHFMGNTLHMQNERQFAQLLLVIQAALRAVSTLSPVSISLSHTHFDLFSLSPIHKYHTHAFFYLYKR